MSYSKLVKDSANFFRKDLRPFESREEVLRLYIKHILEEMNRLEVLSWREPLEVPNKPA